MKTEINLKRQVPDQAESEWQRDYRSAWALSIAMATICVAALVALFWDTVTSAIELWWGQSTYNHAFLILPISAFLVWCKREELSTETPSGSLWGVAVTGVFAFLWLVSDLAEINEGRHIAFIGMLQGILLACFGWQIFKLLLFPILYLWLLVPIGSFLLPVLQDIATQLASSMVRWLGIPVYVEGVLIEVPTGRYNIEPGCAGLNFMLATLALAPLYAYVMYRTAWKRVAAVVVALALAIVMNGVRIAGIIAITHWSDRKLDIVDDHLLYGWGFFALVLLAAGYAGSFFADGEPDTPASKASHSRLRGCIEKSRTIVAGTLSLLTILAVFIYGARATGATAPSLISLESPSQLRDWHKVPWSKDWLPAYPSADLEMRQSYARNGEVVDLFIAYYARQAPGQEMVAYGNRIIDETRWNVVRKDQRMLDLGSQTIPVTGVVADSASGRRHIWVSYWVDDAFTAVPLVAKLLEAKAKLLFRDQRAALIVVSTKEHEGQAHNSDLALRSFLETLSPIDARLKNDVRRTSGPALQQKPR